MLLLKKMLVIDLKPSTLNPTKLIPRASSSITLQNGARLRELSKISSENKRLNSRLVNTSSVYSATKWAEESKHKEYLRDVICHNPHRPLRKELQQFLRNKEMITRILKNREKRPKTTNLEFLDKSSQPISERRPVTTIA